MLETVIGMLLAMLIIFNADLVMALATRLVKSAAIVAACAIAGYAVWYLGSNFLLARAIFFALPLVFLAGLVAWRAHDEWTHSPSKP